MNYTIERITNYTPTLVQPISQMLEELTGRISDSCEEYLQKVIADNNTELFILYCDNKVAGMITLAYYPALSGAKAWIEDVVVLSTFRGQGLARKMVNHAIEYCRQNYTPCTLMLTSNPSRIAANELYRTSGFEPKITNVYKMMM